MLADETSLRVVCQLGTTPARFGCIMLPEIASGNDVIIANTVFGHG